MKVVLLASVLAIVAVSSGTCGGASDLSPVLRTPLHPDTTGPSVVNSSAELDAAPLIELRQEWRVGSASSPASEQFGNVQHMALSPHNELFVLDGTNRVVRVFDSTGKFLRTFGSRGEGPTEFRFPILIAASGDTVVVIEGRQFHTFARDGRGLQTQDYKGIDPKGASVEWVNIRHTAAGWMAITNSQFYDTPPGVPYRDTLAAMTLSAATGARSAGRAKFAGPVNYLFGDLGWLRQEYMGSMPRMAINGKGEFFGTPGSDYKIWVFAPDGTVIRYITGKVNRARVTDAEHKAELATELAKYTPKGPVREGEDLSLYHMLKDDAPKEGHAEFRPVLGRLFAADDGSLIVERLHMASAQEHADSTRWDLLGADGRIRGYLLTPPSIRPRIFTGDAIYANMRDDDNVDSAVKLRLIVPRG